MSGSSGASLVKRPHLESGADTAKRSHLESGADTEPGGKNSAGDGVSASSADARKKGDHGGSVLLMCHSQQPPHHPHLWFFRLVCFPNFWINGEALLLTGLYLI